MNMVDRIVRVEGFLFFSVILSGCESIHWIQEPHFYIVHMEYHTWNDAREYCRSSSDQLLSIVNETDIKFWTEILNRTFLKNRRSSEGVYWTGLHAPDTKSPDSYFFEDCSIPTLFGSGYNGLTANDFQCVAMYSRDFSNLEFERTMCNKTYPFICSNNLNESDCVDSCDELVVLTVKDVCDQLCDNSSCYTTYFNQMQMCQVIPKVYTRSTRFTICYLPSEDFEPNICAGNFENFTLNSEDNNVEVTDTICTHTQQNISFSNRTDGESCECLCEKLWTFLPAPLPEAVNLTIEEKIEIIVNELSVDKKNTTFSRRNYVSVMDYRPSSMGIGIVAGVIIIAVIGIIVFMDLSSRWSEIHSYFLSFLQMFSIIHNNRCEDQYDHVGTSERSVRINNDQVTDIVNSVGWFSRERLLLEDTDHEI